MPDNADPVLLLTRPAPQSRQFAARFAGRLDTVIAPLQKIVPLDVVLDDAGLEAVIFTSENGVRVFAEISPRRDISAFCVGDRTAEVARAMGLAARSAKGAAGDLVAMVLAERPAGRLLHLHGRHVRGDVVDRLRTAGLDAGGLAIYDQVICPPDDAFLGVAAGSRPVIAPLFSPRSAAIFAKALGAARPSALTLPCLSAAVREALPPDLQAYALLADEPSADALTAAITRHISL